MQRRIDSSHLTFCPGGRHLLVSKTGDPVSDDGTVVYQPERIAVSRLTWFDRHGRPTSTLGEPGSYAQKDVNSGAEEPLVVWKEHVVVDEWTPDGTFILFRNLGRAIWAVPADGERKPRRTRRRSGSVRKRGARSDTLLQSQLFQLFVAHRRRRPGHQVDGLSGFWKRDHIADGRLAAENGRDSIES
jgi:hypothetical protein